MEPIDSTRDADDLSRYDAPPLDFDSGRLVQAGETLDVEAKATLLLVPRLLQIPGALVGDFELVDILVSGRSQYQEPGAIPCEVFSDRAAGVEIALDTCEPFDPVVLRVRNRSAQPRVFRARLYACAIETVYWDTRRGVQ
jgi:hypothetical protein